MNDTTSIVYYHERVCTSNTLAKLAQEGQHSACIHTAMINLPLNLHQRTCLCAKIFIVSYGMNVSHSTLEQCCQKQHNVPLQAAHCSSMFNLFLFYVVKIHRSGSFFGLIMHQSCMTAKLSWMIWASLQRMSPKIMNALMPLQPRTTTAL